MGSERDWVSEADLAAYDAASARTFGRPVAESVAAPQEWRQGPPGEMTSDEYDNEAALTFGRYSGAQEAAVCARVEEARRQRAHERELIESAKRIGWAAVVCRSDVDRQVAESIRARAEVETTTAAAPPQARPVLSERRASPPAGAPTWQRVQLEESATGRIRPLGGR